MTALDSAPDPPHDAPMDEDLQLHMLILLRVLGSPEALVEHVVSQASLAMGSAHLLGQMIEEGSIPPCDLFYGPSSEAAAELIGMIQQETEVMVDALS
jgi:hypothetical protein